MTWFVRNAPMLVAQFLDRNQAPLSKRCLWPGTHHQTEKLPAERSQRDTEFLISGCNPTLGRTPSQRYLANRLREATIISAPVRSMPFNQSQDNRCIGKLHQHRLNYRFRLAGAAHL